MTSALPAAGMDAQTLKNVQPMKSFDVKNPKDLAALKKTGQEFESMFLSQMLSHMFSGIKADGLFGGGHAEETYRSLLVDEYGKSISKAGGIGIADQVVRSVLLQFQEASQNVQPRSPA
ncbi:MAG: chemotaxis protein [Alphaproteobacteria bacterium]|nr:chemotaxis protein [Alphaproteobacteria bacterium]